MGVQSVLLSRMPKKACLHGLLREHSYNNRNIKLPGAMEPCHTQVFYDKLVGVKYGTPEEGDVSNKKPPEQQGHAQAQKQEAPANVDSAQPPSSPASDVSSVTQRPDATADKSAQPNASLEAGRAMDVTPSTGTSATAEPAPVTPAAVTSTRVTPKDGECSTAEASAATVTPTVPPPNAAKLRVKSEGAGAAPGAAEGPLRVSMRLSNEMPEFMVVTSKYEEAASFQWRSEMHIQMAFMEEPGGCS